MNKIHHKYGSVLVDNLYILEGIEEYVGTNVVSRVDVTP